MPRVVCFSDTHGRHHRLTGRLAVPDGDVLLFAGDACSEGTPEEWAAFCRWLGELPHPHKVVVPGNHDWPLQPDRPRWNVRARYDAAARALAHRQAEDAGAVLLLDAEATVGGLRVYGTPWVPVFYNWAFNLPRRGTALAEAHGRIPAGLDVLVTHGPAYGRLDRTHRGTRAGCEVLANRLGALAKNGKGPRLHVHGDIHEASGIQRRPGRTTVNAAVLDAHYHPAFAPRVVDLAPK